MRSRRIHARARWKKKANAPITEADWTRVFSSEGYTRLKKREHSTLAYLPAGRKKLIEVMCDQRMLLPTYNQAALEHLRKTNEPLAMWSASVVTLK